VSAERLRTFKYNLSIVESWDDGGC
jgi:hypothetical protein